MDYKDENNWLMLGDCLERMKEIPDGSVDMILTDPPYVLSKSKGGGMMGKDGRKFMANMQDSLKDGIDLKTLLPSFMSLFKSKKHYCGVFFCSNKQLVDYLHFAEENNFQYGVGVWNKTNPAPLCNHKYLNDVEYWVYIKGEKSKILGNYGTKSMVYTSTGNSKESKIYNHPTVKPTPLVEKFLINHTSEFSTVIDPFMGSGTTGVACKNLGRKFIGIEMDEKYFEIAKKRILES